MKVDVVSVVIGLFCIGVGITVMDVSALVSLAGAAVESIGQTGN